MPTSQAPQALHGLTVLERGWLSSNNVLIPDPAGATLVDSGHCVHAPQTLALVQQALQGAPLARVINTHLHSDHCGGNATLQRAFGAAVLIPPGQAPAVAAWDEDRLSYRATGQRCERFSASGTLVPGALLRLGGRAWQVLASPGHDPDAVMLFDTTGGVLLSADALWEHGLGVVFPEIDGIDAFDAANSRKIPDRRRRLDHDGDQRVRKAPAAGRTHDAHGTAARCGGDGGYGIGVAGEHAAIVAAPKKQPPSRM